MAEASPSPQPQPRPSSSAFKQSRPRSGVRCRASKACRRCNEKRVKCDASERGTPCTRCLERREPDCRLIQSRRGIYTRKARHQSAAAEQSSAPEHLVLPDTQQDGIGLDLMPDPDRVDPDPVAAPGPSTSSMHDIPSGDPDPGSASSYSDISWAAMFDHLLRGRREGSDVLDKCSITYLGESFPLALVLKDLKGEHAGPPLLHHPGPPYPASGQAAEPRGRRHPPGMRPEELAFLETKGAFSAPSSDTLDALVGVFLDSVFPIYPIVNRQEYLEQHKSRRTPWILLHALCSVSATFCPLGVLYRAGFDSRQQARWLFYSKAKALFDVGYESNKIVLLQVAILMSFWGGGPNDTWNFYSWIGMGVTIAETIGCHRSMIRTNIKPQDRSLLKRLWWVLVVRDASSAALIGRPFKVNLDHCDVDALSPADFEHDLASSERPASQHSRYSMLYQIQVTKLTIILRRIIMARFQPRREPSLDSALLRQMLADWRSQLPPELSWPGNVGENLNIFACTLSTMYNYLVILTYLGSGSAEPMQTHQSDAPSEDSMAQEATNQAAQQIALVACSVVTRSEILLAPHELFHGVFVAAVVCYMQTKSSNPMIAQLGISGLTNCKMVFQASRETWDPSPWFTQLFDKSLFALNPYFFPENHASNGPDTLLPNLNGAGCVDASMTGLFPLGDMWQNHPVLGSLFDTEPNPSSLMAMSSEFDDRSGMPWFNL
ncbi:fungal-specific transcription factor domain-containing protein [Dactylonectria macrodidyma]|uniref:Fungal-specific transcription factor domain-containing protein n=1 Tax=Dactylonectria macrodidyma TaxID=307937 RepID=A0A9P9JNQ2_9HYPO|nr:fungal-specific transcription factor domain-containing protein [Dactylonectria macrodidyma]